MKTVSRLFDFSERTLLMGILNTTPDSFSDGGRYESLDAALRRAETMIEEGADIIDVGGESTRPGHRPVETDEELRRVIPVIEAIRKRFDVALSVDTSKAVVAEAAVTAGADIINDIWGFQADPQIAAVAAKHRTFCCLMHNRHDMRYENFLDDVMEDLRASIRTATDAGVSGDRIWIDPGLGFAKSFAHNLCVMNHLERFHALGYPVVLGASRKRFIGAATGVTQPDARDIGTAAATAIGVMKGCRIIRVHNIAANREAAALADHVTRQGAEIEAAHVG